MRGTLYVHDDVTLYIEQFYYDGNAPGEQGVGSTIKAHPGVLMFHYNTRWRAFHSLAAYPYFYTKGNQPSDSGGGMKMYVCNDTKFNCTDSECMLIEVLPS